jgi:hypothetical protein
MVEDTIWHTGDESMNEVPDPSSDIPEGARVIRPVMFEDFGEMADVDFRPRQRYEEVDLDPKDRTASETASAIHPSVLPAPSVSVEMAETQTNSISSGESSEENSPSVPTTPVSDNDVIPLDSDLNFD